MLRARKFYPATNFYFDDMVRVDRDQVTERACWGLRNGGPQVPREQRLLVRISWIDNMVNWPIRQAVQPPWSRDVC